MSESTDHVQVAYGTQIQDLVQFSETDFGSPMRFLIASAGTSPVKLIPGNKVTLRDKS